jgi:hypothetical protein
MYQFDGVAGVILHDKSASYRLGALLPDFVVHSFPGRSFRFEGAAGSTFHDKSASNRPGALLPELFELSFPVQSYHFGVAAGAILHDKSASNRLAWDVFVVAAFASGLMYQICFSGETKFAQSSWTDQICPGYYLPSVVDDCQVDADRFGQVQSHLTSFVDAPWVEADLPEPELSVGSVPWGRSFYWEGAGVAILGLAGGNYFVGVAIEDDPLANGKNAWKFRRFSSVSGLANDVYHAMIKGRLCWRIEPCELVLNVLFPDQTPAVHCPGDLIPEGNFLVDESQSWDSTCVVVAAEQNALRSPLEDSQPQQRSANSEIVAEPCKILFALPQDSHRIYGHHGVPNLAHAFHCSREICSLQELSLVR